MMIKCSNCGHENLLGAIFCRNCGEKLDIDRMHPELEKKGPSGGLGGIIRRLVGLLVFLGLVGVIVMMFIPKKGQLGALGDDAKKEAERKYEQLIRKINDGIGAEKYTFSPEEATHIYASKFQGAATQQGGAYNIENLELSLDPAGFIHVLIKTKLGDKIPTTFEVKGSVNNDVKPVSLVVTEACMGIMPIKFLESKVVEKFNPVLDDPNVAKILAALVKVEITDDRQFSITVEQPQSEAPAATKK